MTDLLRIETRDPSRIEALWREFVPAVRLEDIDEQDPRMTWEAASLEGAHLFEYSLRGRARARADDGDQLIVGQILGGDATVDAGAGPLDPAEPYLVPDGMMTSQWAESARFRVVAFDRDWATRAARTLTGDDGLAIRPCSPRPLSPRTALAWTSALDHAQRALFGVGPGNPLIEISIRDMLLSVALTAFDATSPKAVAGGAQHGPAPASLRRAVRFIEENAALPIALADIAQAARMSGRGLQALFVRELDTTPIRYLRTVRLDGARRDLLAAHPGDGETVAAIARRWGFAHLSRFAQYYEQAFHEQPRQTLAR